ncbi:hypothetical protein R50072_35380 [Simiduia litorea]|uniref:hypothetical protein n=1 Tax=Simiduia litorea TaxID=1435348 RepID=UPI0036F414D8
MSEAWGSILIKSSDEVMAALEASDDSVSWDLITRLFKDAGIDSLKNLHPLLSFSEGNEFPHEGLERNGEFIHITIFGDEWMHAMQPLIKIGKGIELYGSISHEHGATEYYALNKDGKSFFGLIDYESGEEFDEESMIKEWLSFVPNEVQEAFPGVFSDEDEE